MPKLDDQIATLADKMSRLKLRQRRIEARRQAILDTRARKIETRRRILVGSLIIDKAARGEFDAALLRSWLDQSLSRADDRALFDLPPRSTAASVLDPTTSSRDV